jgi:threonine synthase
VLELFHGPTLAFKDLGARFLASALEHLPRGSGERLTILVATSGDTGGAVAAAFDGRPAIDVVLLYPRDGVSARQQHQLSCWSANVRAFAVRGSFDDCQRLVKGAFADEGLARSRRLTSANSINVGRLLPQTVPYAWAALLHHREHGEPLGFVVPTGNLGNALAALWARAMGLPVGPIVLATNANRAIPESLEHEAWRPRPGVRTLASAMDVGAASNMERLLDLVPDWRELRERVRAFSVDDAEIRARIRMDAELRGELWCPHTATAAEVFATRLAHEGGPFAIVATAHPAKFEAVVEPLVGRSIEVPESLAALLERPACARELEATPQALRAVLLE